MIKTLRIPAYDVNLLSLFQVIGASLFIALCAQIEMHLFFTPVPITLQTLAVMLVGGTLGPVKGAASVVAYIVEGCLGFPVFSGGAGGIVWLFGPTGGYIFGFIMQAYLTGLWMQRKTLASHTMTVFLLFLSCLIQMGFGVLWLGYFVGWKHALHMGFYPYMPGEMLKCLIAAKILARFRS